MNSRAIGTRHGLYRGFYRGSGALLAACWAVACSADPEIPDGLLGGAGGESASASGGASAAGAPSGNAGAAPVGAGGSAAGSASEGNGGSLSGLSGSAGSAGSGGGAPSGGGDAGAAPDAGEVAGSPGVRFVGRVDTSDPAGARFAWSGTGVVARFTGTSISVRLEGSQEYTVLIDGELGPKLTSTGGSDSLATGLAPGEHQVEVYRRTEANQGVSRFLGFDITGGALLAPPPAPERRIEIIGDSISAGYGDEGVSPCSFSAATENHYLTYGAIAARALQAELSTVAWSGKGVVYNYDTDVVEPMPALYGRTLPQDPASTYDFATIPDVVLINLGTNDFSTGDDPTNELFSGEYGKLLGRVRAVYPSAFILCTVGPLLGGADLTAARAGIASGVAAFEAAGGSDVAIWEMNVPNSSPPGCDSHPSLATHRAMADALIPELEGHFE